MRTDIAEDQVDGAQHRADIAEGPLSGAIELPDIYPTPEAASAGLQTDAPVLPGLDARVLRARSARSTFPPRPRMTSPRRIAC
jgi:hypothetical protein